MKLNLGTVPTIAKVYNKLGDNSGNQIIVSQGGGNDANTSDKVTEQLVVRTNYVTSFRDRLNIKASISPVKIQNITDTENGD
jgi:hypothetical protein